MLTLEEALVRATGQLSAHPKLRETALPDAVLLLRHSLALTRAALIAHPERRLTRDQQADYQRLIERRLSFEPIQYILGTQEFFGLTLRVTPAVLIPRPETETLVEAVLARLPASSDPARPLRLVDVGTGSGAIALALAHALPQALITALELSPAALELAQHNAATLNLDAQITFASSDLLDALTGQPAFDAIVSNPPYIAAADASTLHPQILDHEPHEALFAGATGLEVYQRLIPQARTCLKPGGLLALEIGYTQREPVAALLAGWHDVEFVADLQHIPRVALARR